MSNATPTSHIFRSPNGGPYKFFVEAAAVRGRPAIVRKITNYGGQIMTRPKEADILLGENYTREAMELIEAWSGDKVVLSTRWINRCIESNAFLGPQSNWGDCLLDIREMRDSLVNTEEQNDHNGDSTAHGTPLKLPSSQSSIQRTLPIVDPSRWEPSPPKRRKLSNFAEEPLDSLPLPPPPPPPSSLPLPPRPQFENNIAFPPSQPTLPRAFPSSSQPNLTTQPALFTPMSGGLSQPVSMQAHQQWDMLSLFNQPMSLLPLLALGQLNNNSPQLLAAQLREAADRLTGQTPASSPVQMVPTTPSSPQTSQLRSSPLHSQRVSRNSSVFSEGEVESSILVPSRKRKSVWIENGHHTDEGNDVGSTKRNSHAESCPEYKKGIFTERGKSMTFYIMLDIQQRKQLLQLVRKHGGRIVMRMDDADNIILNNRSSQFQKTCELLPADKIALSRAWLEECDKEGVLIPKAPYVLDASSGVGRGIFRRKFKTPSSKMKRPKEESVEQDYDSEESNSMEPNPTQTGGSQCQNERSPSPPSPLTPRSAKSNTFTVADREWFFRYVRAKFKQKPEISWSALSKMVACKAPYHSATSWHNAARTRWKDEYELVSREQTQYLMQRYPKGETILHAPKKPGSPTTSTPQQSETSYTNQQVKRDPDEESAQLDQLYGERG